MRREARNAIPVTGSSSCSAGRPARAIRRDAVRGLTPQARAMSSRPSRSRLRSSTAAAAVCAGVADGDETGRDDRSDKPASPWAR